MLFSSLEFLLLFLPIVLIVYFIIPHDVDIWNLWLLIVSLLFYAWGEPTFVIIMIVSILVNYLAAMYMDSQRKKRKKKLVLIVTVAANIAFLFSFKYLNFFTGTLRGVFPMLKDYVPQTSIALPIGISFFTFQEMSYVIDVYRGIKVQRDLFDFALYVSFFPQLIAGPIVRYTTVMEEIKKRTVSWNGFFNGFLRFMVGFNKKVLLSNVFSEIAEQTFGKTGMTTGTAWVGALAYTFQIFFDFSGYSDMAIGLGEIFGFHFVENFTYPYISKTITEFWRRWHISLGSWFRDYVYFPMGGSRVESKARLIINLMTVWLLTGIWHGANWTFIVWGVMYGVVIVIEKLLNVPKRIDHWLLPSRIIYRCFTMLLVVLGWVIFNSASLPAALSYIREMFTVSNGLCDTTCLHLLREYYVYFIVAIIASVPLVPFLRRELIALIGAKSEKADQIVDGIWGFIQAALFLCGVSCLVMNAHNPFIYFNF